MDISQNESQVAFYCRSIPEVFETAEGATMRTPDGRRFTDFLSGCGSLNYGHNHPALRQALLSYVSNKGIAMSLDMATRTKHDFMELLTDKILGPRSLDYRIQFPGPTGANAVEAAIKLARKLTGRSKIVAFTNAFHGCSLGALALTGNRHHRDNSEALLTNVQRVPFDGYQGPDVDTSDLLGRMVEDPSSGFDLPAAIIVETIQGEGGLNVASPDWLRNIARIARENGILLIVDDIQVGCGRSGAFFSFEGMGVEPDIVCLAKSISGFGLPMSLVLLKPEHDAWKPGEHNGTFRGNNLAFVTAAEAIRQFWCDGAFIETVTGRIAEVDNFLNSMVQSFPDRLRVRGRGMMKGLEFTDPDASKAVQMECISRGLVIELCGPQDEVLKLLPPLNISDAELAQGTAIIEEAIGAVLQGDGSLTWEVA